MERLLKLFIEEQANGKFSVLYTRKGLKDGALIENLTLKQLRELYGLLKKLGFDVFFLGTKEHLTALDISEEAKVPTDDVFKTFRKLQPWEVWE